MFASKKARPRTALAAALLLAAATVSLAHGAEMTAPAAARLPAGWAPLADTNASVSGAFQRAGSRDTAVLVQHGAGGDYGVALIPAEGPGRIVANFHESKANPSALSLVKPGDYHPVCHDGGQCQPVKLATEAIGLCFGEASCKIIYARDGVFQETFVTD